MSLPVKQGNDFILQKLKVNQIYNHTNIKLHVKAEMKNIRLVIIMLNKKFQRAATAT